MLIAPKIKIQYPISLEREYARELVRYTRKVRDICLKRIPFLIDAILANSIHNDDWTEETTEEVESDIEEEIAIIAIILAMFAKVKKFNRRQQEKVFRSIFSGLPNDISPSNYEKIKQIWVNQNIDLIRSIDQRTMESIRYTLSRNVIQTVDKKMLQSELKESIMHMANVNEKRAVLIAADQVGKLNSQLTQLEQMQQGVDSYIWQTRLDNRVRPEHRAREGQRYYWNEPPAGGHPGWAIRCRCTSRGCYDTDKIGLRPRAGTYKIVE